MMRCCCTCKRRMLLWRVSDTQDSDGIDRSRLAVAGLAARHSCLCRSVGRLGAEMDVDDLCHPQLIRQCHVTESNPKAETGGEHHE